LFSKRENRMFAPMRARSVIGWRTTVNGGFQDVGRLKVVKADQRNGFRNPHFEIGQRVNCISRDQVIAAIEGCGRVFAIQYAANGRHHFGLRAVAEIEFRLQVRLLQCFPIALEPRADCVQIAREAEKEQYGAMAMLDQMIHTQLRPELVLDDDAVERTVLYGSIEGSPLECG